MLKLNLTGQPELVALAGGATLECKALDYRDVIDAMAEMQPGDTMFEQVVALGGVVVTGWTGIHDDAGAPLAFDAALVPALMRQPQVWSPFWEQYARRAMNMVQEGNGSAPSADGTPAEESGSAEGASTSTGRAAGRARSGSARQTKTAGRSGGSTAKKAPRSRG
jgi:hypothetical protein